MNIFRRVAVFVQYRALEILLFLSILSLVGQLFWPSALRWWRLPSPGKPGIGSFQSDSLAEQYNIYLPESYFNRESWPLVVFLHGSGDCGNDPSIVHDCGTLRRGLPSIVVAPQCLPSINWEPDAVVALIHHVSSRYRVDRDRVYLVGYSMDGYGTWQTADAFAGIAPICGGGNPGQAKAFVNLPAWAIHGEKDDVVPVAESRRMVDAIESAGGHPKLTIIPGGGHGICDSVCCGDELWQWLFEQKRSR